MDNMEVDYDHDDDVTVDIFETDSFIPNNAPENSTSKCDFQTPSPAEKKKKKIAMITESNVNISRQDDLIGDICEQTTQEGKWLKVKKNPAKTMVTASSNKTATNLNEYSDYEDLEDLSGDEPQIDTPTMNLFSRICAVSNLNKKDDEEENVDQLVRLECSPPILFSEQQNRHTSDESIGADYSQLGPPSSDGGAVAVAVAAANMRVEEVPVSRQRAIKRPRRSFAPTSSDNSEENGIVLDTSLQIISNKSQHVAQQQPPTNADLLAFSTPAEKEPPQKVQRGAATSALDMLLETLESNEAESGGAWKEGAVASSAPSSSSSPFAPMDVCTSVARKAFVAARTLYSPGMVSFIYDSIFSPIQRAFGSPAEKTTKGVAQIRGGGEDDAPPLESSTGEKRGGTADRVVKELSFDDL